jgi:hypothetical protein
MKDKRLEVTGETSLLAQIVTFGSIFFHTLVLACCDAGLFLEQIADNNTFDSSIAQETHMRSRVGASVYNLSSGLKLTTNSRTGFSTIGSLRFESQLEYAACPTFPKPLHQNLFC